MELYSLVSSLKYLVSNGRQVLLGDIRLGCSATWTAQSSLKPINNGFSSMLFPLSWGERKDEKRILGEWRWALLPFLIGATRDSLSGFCGSHVRVFYPSSCGAGRRIARHSLLFWPYGRCRGASHKLPSSILGFEAWAIFLLRRDWESGHQTIVT